jgi:hypothetical protein
MNDWLNQLGGMLQQYANSGQATQSTENDFEHAASIAPRDAMAGGLADAFRSNQTPPFPSMLGQMFGNSSGMQRANILNMLLATAGPALLSSIIQRGGGMGNLGGLLQGGQVTPQVAEQIPAETIEELAREAEQRDPSVIDRVSDFYAEHPTLVKSLGAAALAIAMSGMTKQRRGLL